MVPHLKDCILNATKAEDLCPGETIQNLWSGYGSLDRYRLKGSEFDTVVVKHVRFPAQNHHPRGWNTDVSDQRKRRSYQVEAAWYKNWAGRCDSACRVPRCLAVEHIGEEVVMVMEDLAAAGYPQTPASIGQAEMFRVLDWLANFHATFMGETPAGLWPIGSYWHLATRPDELNALADGPLKQAASALDKILNEAPFQTFVHGDAKLANFCFSDDGRLVAAVDFQYTGGGCGMKDVAYFISSCLDEKECERHEETLLDYYFNSLSVALKHHQATIDANAVECAWRPLYGVAWTDFYRFLQGWSPGHWKNHGYSARLAREVLGSTYL
jgi:hypothetical protein